MINSKKNNFARFMVFARNQSLKLQKKFLFFTKISRKLKEYAIWRFFQRDGVLGTIKIALFANHGDIYCWHMIFFCQIIFCSYIFSHFDTFFLFLFDFGVSEGIADLF